MDTSSSPCCPAPQNYSTQKHAGRPLHPTLPLAHFGYEHAQNSTLSETVLVGSSPGSTKAALGFTEEKQRQVT